MGKRNKKPRTGGTADTNPNSELIASFDENALSALTAQIEKGLGVSNPVKEETKSSTKEGSKRKSKATELVKGTKRDAHGIAKASSKGKSNSHGTAEEQNDSKETDSRAILLQEILALGGTEDDLELVADAASDEEEDNDQSQMATTDKYLQKELASFVAGLGIEVNAGNDDAESIADENEANDGIPVEEMDDEWEAASDASDLHSSIASEKKIEEKKESEEEPFKIHSAKAAVDASNNPNRLIFQARPDWHAAELPSLPNPEGDDPSKHRDVIANLKAYADSLLEADSKLYASKQLSQGSSQRFLATIMTSGTLSDKVSALTLVVQESPVHTTRSFGELLALAKKRSRGQAVTALGAMKDLLGQGVVLPADRRLRTFGTQPGLLGTLQEVSLSQWNTSERLPGDISKAHLISWAYEDWLKESYFDMLKVLEGWCSDEIEYARSRAVTYVYELLKDKPEQEANLLRLLVNKLGDPDKKIASRTSYLLLQLQISHPMMKPIIVRSIENELLLRPGQSTHAKYYAINTLNQTILSGKEEDVAKKLLSIYFDLFVSLLKKPETGSLGNGPVVNNKGQVQGGGAPKGKKAKAKATKEEESKLANEETTEKMISAVLTGVNRAFPFSKSDDQSLEKHMDTLFRITHSSNFNTSIQALMLIEQLSTSKHLAVDRFYRTLYESLLDPRLVTSSKHALYLNLLFKALRADLNLKRVKAFAKRLLQVVHLHLPPFICGALYLLRELEATFPGLKTLFNDPEENEDDEEEVFRDVPEDGIVQETKKSAQEDRKNVYDGRKRDPEYSNADKSCLWEAVPFQHHYHPSAKLFADRLLNGEKMPPKPDLASHTLSSFLDRFVYRNAKAQTTGSRGTSIMQPLSGDDSRGALLSARNTNQNQDSVNTESFWRKKVEDVAVDEVFFHEYFSKIGKAKQVSNKKKTAEKAPGAGSGDEDDEEENEIWDALVNSRPEVEGPSDGESDLEMLDLDDSDAGSDMEASDAESGEVDIEGSELDSEAEGEDADIDDAGSDIDEDEDALFAQELETAKPVEAERRETSRQKKKKLKGLPTFASAEDYAAMLDNDEGEDIPV